jgi:hypothetical protein
MKPQDQTRVIERWMLQVSQDGGIERFDDLHIDQIDPRWKNRPLWAEASSSAFRSGVDVRNRLKLPLIVGLGMSLHSDTVVGDDIGLAELITQVDWSPPSLYLFREGQEPGSDLNAEIRSGRIDADAVSMHFRAIDVPAAKSGVILRFRRSRSGEHTTSAFLFG